MSKWINERAWMISMCICYVLCSVILIVAGYNYTMSIIGDTTSFMKVVLLICIILFVGFGVSMVFSIFITPLSELLNRLAVFLFEKKKFTTPTKNAEGEMEVLDENLADDAELQKSSSSTKNHDNNKDEVSDSIREALKAEFMSEYVKYDHQEETIYEVFEVLFSEKKSGAFAAHAFKCAMNEKWLKCFPGYEAAKKLFPKGDSIKGNKSNYSNANNNTLSPAKEAEIKTILLDKFSELNLQSTDGQV